MPLQLQSIYDILPSLAYRLLARQPGASVSAHLIVPCLFRPSPSLSLPFPHSHLCVRVHPIFADFALCSRILSYITTPSCHSVLPLGSLILAPVTKAPAPCPSHHINHVLLDACQSRFFPCIAPSARVLQPYRHLIKFSVTSRIPSPQPAHISRCPVCLGHSPLHLIFSCLLYPIFHPITSFCSCLQPYFSNEPEQL